MACEELEVGLTQNARPQGMLAADARPQGTGLCRTYDFSAAPPSTDSLVTFALDDLRTFAGDLMVALT